MVDSRWIFLCLAGTILAPVAHAQRVSIACGASVTTNNVGLTSDLGPCTDNGLFINSSQTAVTVNLNGHTLLGAGRGAGLIIGTSTGGVTVKGPGQISGFGTGILIQDDDVLVYNVTLKANQVGIAAGANRIRVVSNTIRGEGQGTIGVSTGNGGDIFVYQNTITGHSEAGVAIFGESKTSVDGNKISNNQTGIFAGPPDLVCFTIRGNHIFNNRADGIDVSPNGIGSRSATALAMPGGCFLVEDNRVTENQGSGIVMDRASTLAQVLIQDNIVRGNQVDGIELIGGRQSEVIGNVAIRNASTDLVWDSVNSPDSCWKQNIFGTSSPSALPSCP